MKLFDALENMREIQETDIKTYEVAYNGNNRAKFNAKDDTELAAKWWDFSNNNDIPSDCVDYIVEHEFGTNADIDCDLIIVHKNVDDRLVVNIYKSLDEFDYEWWDDDKCISIGDEFICAVYKGVGYFGFGTVEDFCIAIPDLNAIIKF